MAEDTLLTPDQILAAQARTLGLKVDRRWSVDTLAEKVQDAQEAAAAAEQRAVEKASDTWIFCLRDCFVGTDKHPAGSVVRAPKELYQRFKATGAARLADEDEING
jgi:hypothetical protein